MHLLIFRHLCNIAESFVMSLCPSFLLSLSLLPNGTTRLPLDEFSWKCDKSKVTFHEEQQIFLSYLAQFFLGRQMFLSKFVDNMRTHFRFNNLFRNLCRLWNNLEKFYRPSQDTYDNRIHIVWWIPKATKLSHTAPMVAWTHLNVTLRVYCLSSYWCSWYSVSSIVNYLNSSLLC